MMARQTDVDKLFDEVTKDFTPSDWENIDADELRFSIAQFLGRRINLSDSEIFEAKFVFEEWMGW